MAGIEMKKKRPPRETRENSRLLLLDKKTLIEKHSLFSYATFTIIRYLIQLIFIFRNF